MRTRALNLASLERVARALSDLLSEIAFVGGATTALYIDDPAAPDSRFTDDIDCVVEVASRPDFYRFEGRLRALGFVNSMEKGDPICRWIYQGTKVDVMPKDPSIMGFSNLWYPEAMEHRQPCLLAGGLEISIFPVRYFLATKLEAFKSRGFDDWLLSTDLEDIIAVMDGRMGIQRELAAISGELQQYLIVEFSALLSSPFFGETISAHLPSDSTNARRTQRIVKLLREFVGVKQ